MLLSLLDAGKVCFLLSFSGPSTQLMSQPANPRSHAIFQFCFSVNRVFEKYFEGFRGWECRIMHRINLLYLLNLAEPQSVQILRGRHPANPRSHANFAVNRVFERYFEGSSSWSITVTSGMTCSIFCICQILKRYILSRVMVIL